MEPDSPEDVEPSEPEFEFQTPRRPGWAETHLLDIDDSETTLAEEKEYDERAHRIESDPLAAHAGAYGSDVWEILRPVLNEANVTEAVHDIYSLSLTIAAKTRRAIGSFEFNKDEETELDPVQNDANGSAKVVLLSIEQSTTAWNSIAQAGVVDPGLVKHLVEELAVLQKEVREQFPFAMAFVRPGFDEEIPGIVRPWKLDAHEDEEDED